MLYAIVLYEHQGDDVDKIYWILSFVFRSQFESRFLVVEPSKIIFLIENTIPQKEYIILLYIGYPSIPQ